MGEPSPGHVAAEPSDADLIAAIRSGETAAYGPLYERHLDAARSLARHMVRSEAEADDVVAETFTKVLDVLRRGGGPDIGFRPYLLTAVRRTVIDRARREGRVRPTDEIEVYDPGAPFVDPALAGLERSMIARAFLSLPERWRVVLWHTEIEEAKPAEVAPLLGLTANGVAALAYRAREGLRQAYLQMHLAANPRQACRPVLDRLGAYVRGGLSRREATVVDAHLDECDECRAVYTELTEVNQSLRAIVGPLIAGPVFAAYLASSGKAAAGGLLGWWHNAPREQQVVVAGVAAVMMVAGVAGLGVLVRDAGEPGKPRPPVVAPPLPPPAAPKPPPPGAPGAPPAPPGAPPGPPAAPPGPPAAPGPPGAPPAAPPAPPGGPGQPAQPQPAQPQPEPGQPPPEQPQQPPQEPPPPTEPLLAAPNQTAEPSPEPTPQALAAAVAEPRLVAATDAVGALRRGRPGVVGARVANEGDATSEPIVADFALPEGVTMLSAVRLARTRSTQPSEAAERWACRPTAGGARCSREPLPAGRMTSVYLRVDVAGDAPRGEAPQLTVRAGDLTVAARGTSGVRSSGMPARYAVDGRVRSVAIGNSMMSCVAAQPGCQQARDRGGTRRDNDLWRMLPLDLDDQPLTLASSAAKLTLPSGGRVLWAGLYWSGVAGGPQPSTVRIRRPGTSGYRLVRAEQVDRLRLPAYSAYQAFAEVTALVRASGAGTWWVADVPTIPGPTSYAGWSLVVVTTDPTAPFGQTMVLDTPLVFGKERPRIDIPLAGMLPEGLPADITMIAWEGDADLRGDRVLLGGSRLTPLLGDRDDRNAFDSSPKGALGPALSFGVDVDTFGALLPRRPTLELCSRKDAVIAGVVTVTTRFSR